MEIKRGATAVGAGLVLLAILTIGGIIGAFMWASSGLLIGGVLYVFSIISMGTLQAVIIWFATFGALCGGIQMLAALAG